MAQNPMKNQASRRVDTQAGNVFFLIFLFVALFAALSYTMLQSGRSTSASLSSEKARLVATEMLDYGAKMRDAVRLMMVQNDCSDTMISFDGSGFVTPTIYDYENPNAPDDESCHVFKPNGGNMKWVSFFKDIPGAHMKFSAFHCYAGVGTGGTSGDCDETTKDLQLNYIEVPESVCIEINRIAGIGAPGALPPSENWQAGNALAFTGVYPPEGTTGNIINIGAGGKLFGCYRDNAGQYLDKYAFYYTLIAR